MIKSTSIPSGRRARIAGGILAAVTAGAALAGGSAAVAHAEDQPTMPGGSASASTSGSSTQTSAITWHWKYGATFALVVRDTKADRVHAQGRVQTLSPSGAVTSYRWHSAVGAGRTYNDSTYVKNSAGVRALRVETCRVGKALPTSCSYSTWKWNGFYS